MNLTAIQAAAGCGKTTEIVRRYLSFLDAGLPVESIIAITFTRKAAGELVERIYDELTRRGDSDVHLAALPSAPIGTTDSFVRQVLEANIGWAYVPCPDGSRAALDLPIRPQNSLQESYDWAATRQIYGPLTPDLKQLITAFGIEQTHRQVQPRDPFDRRPIATAGTLQAAREKAEARSIQRAQDTVWLNMGSARVSLSALVDALGERRDWHSDSDALAEARERLRIEVATQALTRAARRGELDHDSLTQAATELFRDPPPRLRNAYRALLVDEAQDANPRQLQLYRAIAECPADTPIESIFVGDLRQSIYLFRNAEPRGFGALVQEAAQQGKAPSLSVHYRAHSQLLSANQSLIQSLEGPLHRARLDPIDPASQLVAAENTRGQALSPEHHPDPRPIWIVRGTEPEEEYSGNIRGLHAFLSRLQDAWSEPGHEADTAVVLAPTWRLCQQACSNLRSWSGDETFSWVDGGAGILSQRISDDVRHWIRALEDPTDDWAWLAVFKHPSVGLSDAAITRIRRGEGLIGGPPDTPAPIHLSRLLSSEGLSDVHLDEDREAFGRAVPPLRAALAAIQTENLAHVLDSLMDALGWRTVLSAGPGSQDDLAALDVLLDVLRSRTHSGDGPVELARALRRVEDLEISRLSVNRPIQGVTCTTVFRAKGLDWDHVCLLSPGRPARTTLTDPEPQGVWARVGEQEHRLSGFLWRPDGSLQPQPDPSARVAMHIAERRQTSECARMAYVGLTRARRSVTVATADTKLSIRTLQGPLTEAFRGVDHPGIAQIEWGEPLPKRQLPVGSVAWTAAKAPDRPLVPPLRSRQAPSSLAAHMPQEQRVRMAKEVAKNGHLHVRGPAIHPSQPDQASPTQWGDLAHAWLGHWRFGPTPTGSEVRDWLQSRWPTFPDTAASWLTQISQHLCDPSDPVYQRISDPSHQVWTEVALVGTQPNHPTRWSSGRIDLLVETPQGLWIIDYKAGADVPTSRDDCVQRGHLEHYVPQLEAYRDMCKSQGRSVVGLGLWYVRTGSSVFWT